MTMQVTTTIMTLTNVADASKCHRKQVTKVTAADGRSVEFTEKLSKKEAIRQAQKFFAR
jgi:hypothetical protein